MVNTNKLKAAIVMTGLTQDEVAAKIGLGKNSFNLKINGKSDFWLKEVMALCALLNIDDEDKIDIFLN